MKLEEIIDRKREKDDSYEELAHRIGFSAEKIRKMLEGEPESTDYAVLEALEEIFVSKSADEIRETQAAYKTQKRQGEFTLDDYYALPDERRVELIDGVIYDMAAPTSIHQVISLQLSIRFFEYIKSRKETCVPLNSPVDVQLDCDSKTIVQPDVTLVCDRNQLREGKIYGAPDLVIEILSKSTRKKDSIIKLNKYMDAGVQEYWIVDPEKKKIMVYDFQSDTYPVIYGFEDIIPVGIFGGDCKIDFAEIYGYIKFLYEEEDTK
ncbi:MAG: Uma2 family endonuclease [Lachnospiraceae bacterium]|nr:Uma2 family endonuclease [Lachnospiraceae bacterium]